MIKHISRITIGIGVIVFSVVCIFFLFRRVLNIYDAPVLRWIPILSTFIGFYFAGYITKEIKFKYVALLLLSLLVFIPVRFFYFPLIIFLLFFAILALALHRREIRKNVKLLFSIIGLLLFAFILFSQPLIIRQKGFEASADGTLTNAKVLWNFNKHEPKTLPVATFVNLENERIRLQDFKDKTIYISFWATWCGPCKAEKPLLDKLKEDFKDNEEVIFVDISIDKDRGKWEAYLEKYQPEGIQLLSESESLTRRDFGIIGIPVHLLVNNLNQYKSLREISSAKAYLENEEMLNEWIQNERSIIEKEEFKELVRK